MGSNFTAWFGSSFVYAIAALQTLAAAVFIGQGGFRRGLFWACLAGANLCAAGLK